MNDDRLGSAVTTAAVLVVAAIAAVVSYIHIEHLAVINGQTALAAMLLMLSAVLLLLARVTLRAALVVPACCSAKSRVGVESTAVGPTGVGSWMSQALRP